MDDLKKVKNDRKRINPEEPYEVRYWTKKLGVNREHLLDLVKRFRGSVTKIRKNIRHGVW